MLWPLWPWEAETGWGKTQNTELELTSFPVSFCIPSSGDDCKHDVKVARGHQLLKVQQRTCAFVHVCFMTTEQVNVRTAKRAECDPSLLRCVSGHCSAGKSAEWWKWWKATRQPARKYWSYWPSPLIAFLPSLSKNWTFGVKERRTCYRLMALWFRRHEITV